MNEEMKEFVEALQELKIAMHDLYRQALMTERAMNEVINNSHLRSTLTLLKDDIGLRSVLELTNRL